MSNIAVFPVLRVFFFFPFSSLYLFCVGTSECVCVYFKPVNIAYCDPSHKQEIHSLKYWFSTGCGEKDVLNHMTVFLNYVENLP